MYDAPDYKRAVDFLEQSKRCFKGEESQMGEIYLYLARSYYYLYEDSLTALNYQKAAHFFESNGDHAALSKVYNSYGNFIAALALYDSAIILFDKSIQMAEQGGNDVGIPIALNNKGNALKNLGKYKEALDALYESLRLYKENDAGDKRLSISMLNIGALLDILGKTDLAIDFYKSSLKKKQLIGDSAGMARIYTNIGIIKKNEGQLDSALYYYNLSVRTTSEERKDNNVWQNLINIGTIKMIQREFDEAHPYFEKALTLAEQLKDLDKIGESYYKIGENYFNRNEFSIALDQFDKAIIYINSTNSYQDKKDMYEMLVKTYKAVGDLQNALSFTELAKLYQDSIYIESQAMAIEEVTAKYETEKKDQKIDFLNQENQIQKANNERNTVLIVALLIVLALASFIFYLWQQRTKIHQKQILNEQKIRMREAQIKAVISSQEKERKRFAEDLHDSMGQLISSLTMNIQSLRTDGKDIEVKNEIVENSTLILSDIQNEIRNIAFNLMPQILTKEGLIPALKELANRINKSKLVKAEVQTYGLDDRFSEVYEISLYRILQEWISNILKYAGATKIFIQFTEHEHELIITVEDNGNGFDIDQLVNGSGNGWRNINSRLSLIRAEIDIDTLTNRKNTTLTINFDKKDAFRAKEVEQNTEG